MNHYKFRLFLITVILKTGKNPENLRIRFRLRMTNPRFSLISRVGLILILFVYSFELKAQEILSLDAVLKQIETTSPMLKMYDEQIKAIKNNAEMAKSWMPPTLSTGLWQTPYYGFTDGMLMLTVEQMIPNPVKQQANFDFMQSMTGVEAQAKSVQRNSMFSMAKLTYYEWVVLKKKRVLLVQTDSLLSNIVQIAQLRYSLNKEKLSSIFKMQAELFELRNMETMTNGDIKMKNAELSALMNRVGFVFDVDTVLSQKFYEIQSIDPAKISSSKSEIKQYDASKKYSELQQEYEKSKRLPEFGISMSHMQAFSAMMPNQYSIMGMIRLPIAPWASKEYESAIAGLDNTMAAIEFQKQALINETAGKLSSLQIQIKSVKEQLANYQHGIMPSYEKVYQSSMIGYEQNTEDVGMVLDGAKMVLMAKMQALDLLNNLLKLQSDYEKEMEIR